MATAVLPSQASHTSFEPRQPLGEVPNPPNAEAQKKSQGTKRKSPEDGGEENHVDLDDIDVVGMPITDERRPSPPKDQPSNSRTAAESGDSKVFYAAQVFFEKKRVAEGKGRTKKREEMEKVWPEGVDLEKFGVRRLLCTANQRPAVDQYGKTRMVDLRTKRTGKSL